MLNRGEQESVHVSEKGGFFRGLTFPAAALAAVALFSDAHAQDTAVISPNNAAPPPVSAPLEPGAVFSKEPAVESALPESAVAPASDTGLEALSFKFEPPLPEIDLPEAIDQVRDVVEPENLTTESQVTAPAIAAPSTERAAASPAAQRTRLDMQRVQEQWDHAMDWLKKGAVGAIAAISLISGLRGVGKLLESYREKTDARKNFTKKEHFDVLTSNIHIFSPEGEKLKMEAYALTTPPLSEVIPNSYARSLFVAAARKCTQDQPFPLLNFARDKGTDRISGLQRTNRLISQEFTSEFSEGFIANVTGLPVHREEFVLIPFCEVNRFMGQPDGKSVCLIAISRKDFGRFGDPDILEKVTVTDTQLLKRARDLQAAFKLQQEYAAKHTKDGRGEELFPTVAVYLKH